MPLIGTWVSSLLFGGPYPGPETLNRLFVAHILLIPALIAVLIAVHLALVVRHKHTQYPRARQAGGQRRRPAAVADVHGQGRWPVLPRRASVLAALGGLAQINAIWVTGPYRQADVSSASQPDWYMGWTEGGLRLMPPFEIRAFGFQIPNPFFPGVLLPTVVFGILYLWPFLPKTTVKQAFAASTTSPIVLGQRPVPRRATLWYIPRRGIRCDHVQLPCVGGRCLVASASRLVAAAR